VAAKELPQAQTAAANALANAKSQRGAAVQNYLTTARQNAQNYQIAQGTLGLNTTKAAVDASIQQASVGERTRHDKAGERNSAAATKFAKQRAQQTGYGAGRPGLNKYGFTYDQWTAMTPAAQTKARAGKGKQGSSTTGPYGVRLQTPASTSRAHDRIVQARSYVNDLKNAGYSRDAIRDAAAAGRSSADRHEAGQPAHRQDRQRPAGTQGGQGAGHDEGADRRRPLSRRGARARLRQWAEPGCRPAAAQGGPDGRSARTAARQAGGAGAPRSRRARPTASRRPTGNGPDHRHRRHRPRSQARQGARQDEDRTAQAGQGSADRPAAVPGLARQQPARPRAASAGRSVPGRAGRHRPLAARPVHRAPRWATRRRSASVDQAYAADVRRSSAPASRSPRAASAKARPHGHGPSLNPLAVIHLPSAYVKALAHPNFGGMGVVSGAAGVAGRSAKDAEEMAVTLPSSVAHLASTAVHHPEKVPGELLAPYKQLAKHPVKSLSEHPLQTALMVAPAVRMPGRVLGKGLRVAGKQTLTRPAATLPGTAFKVTRTGSRDAVVRALQSHLDRKHGAPLATVKDVQQRVDEHFDAERHLAQHAETRAVRVSRKATKGQPRQVRRDAATQAREQARAHAHEDADQRFAQEFGANVRLSTGAAERELAGRMRAHAVQRVTEARGVVRAANAEHERALGAARVAKAKAKASPRLRALETQRTNATRALVTEQKAATATQVEHAPRDWCSASVGGAREVISGAEGAPGPATRRAARAFPRAEGPQRRRRCAQRREGSRRDSVSERRRRRERGRVRNQARYRRARPGRRGSPRRAGRRSRTSTVASPPSGSGSRASPLPSRTASPAR
jgi:hypothetical protein